MIPSTFGLIRAGEIAFGRAGDECPIRGWRMICINFSLIGVLIVRETGEGLQIMCHPLSGTINAH